MKEDNAMPTWNLSTSRQDLGSRLVFGSDNGETNITSTVSVLASGQGWTRKGGK